MINLNYLFFSLKDFTDFHWTENMHIYVCVTSKLLQQTKKKGYFVNNICGVRGK